MSESYGECSFCGGNLTSEHNCQKPKADYARSNIIKFFSYDHLPESLQEISKPFGVLALDMDMKLPPGAEKSAGLRKLLEAKDCLVRAFVEAQYI